MLARLPLKADSYHRGILRQTMIGKYSLSWGLNHIADVHYMLRTIAGISPLQSLNRGRATLRISGRRLNRAPD
jgi:hypothetical protein